MSHCLVKQLYGRTNKHDMTKQIGRHIRWLEHAQDATEWNQLNVSETINEGMMEQESDAHHQISKSWNDCLNIYSYVYANQGDPAFVVCRTFEWGVLLIELICWCQQFIPKLKDHILEHLLNWEYEGDTYSEFMDEDRNTILIASEEIFCCKTLWINYTTYDVRQDSDTIKPTIYPDVIVKSPETGPHVQPY